LHRLFKLPVLHERYVLAKCRWIVLYFRMKYDTKCRMTRSEK